MLWILASIVLVVWLVMLAFKITAGAVHLLLVLAVALYLWSFLRGRTRTAT